jgi:hypothetical protein
MQYELNYGGHYVTFVKKPPKPIYSGVSKHKNYFNSKVIYNNDMNKEKMIFEKFT